jgi:uncharacterized protein DUF5317
MLLVITAILLVVSVPMLGGQLGRLADVRLRATWAVFLSAAIQVLITAVARGGSHGVHVALHFVSYGFAAWFLIANRSLVGMPLVALGTGLNVLAISLNGGTMPASTTALRISGIDTSGGFDNSGAVPHPHLAFLGDVIPVPGPWPIGNVLSVGDLIIFIGALVVLHRVCGSRLALRRPARAVSPPRASESPAVPAPTLSDQV